MHVNRKDLMGDAVQSAFYTLSFLERVLTSTVLGDRKADP